jgi:hypothetical protein
MTAGIEVLNGFGNYLIDQVTPNLYCTGGPYAITAGTTYLGRFYRPLAAVFRTTAAENTEGLSEGAGRDGVFPAVGYFYQDRSWTAGGSETLYIFDYLRNPPANEFGGLEVLSATGERLFHTGGKVLNIVDMFTVARGTTVTKTYTAGRKYAVIEGMMTTGFVFHSNVAAGTVTVTGNSNSSIQTSCLFLVADVTDY